MDSSAALCQRFDELWRSSTPYRERLVVAVSGGADSVALLRLIARSGPSNQLTVAHFDHGLRPSSRDDELFVSTLARQLGLDVRAGRANDCEIFSDEARCRQARYRFLQHVAEEIGARYVAVGHSADDQAETILQRIIRGTGLRGLAGMRPHRQLGPAVTVIRPLLRFSRSDLVSYLRDIGQNYREDPTNADSRYTRNRIRHELLPLLRANYSHHVVAALLRLAQQAADANEEIAKLVSALKKHLQAEVSAGYASIETVDLDGTSEYLVREMLADLWRLAGWPEQAMGYDEWQRMARMALAGNPASAMFPHGVHAIVHERHFVLRSHQNKLP